MRYASIRNLDISNGEGIGVSIFVQGCDRQNHCKNCFNPETWSFDGGKEWTDEVKSYFFSLIERPYIKRVSILGGEPLAYNNLPEVYDIVKEIHQKYPNKKIWLYTGWTLGYSIDKHGNAVGNFADADIGWDNGLLRNHILRNCDIVVDGEYVEELRDITLPFRGSSNQRIIDVKRTLQENKIVEYKV